jgi:hypothetical protein
MIDDNGTLVARLQADADAILRLVAPDDCPVWSPSLVLAFDAIGVDSNIQPTLHGLSAAGLDNFAAWHFDNPALRGRPVFAVNVARIIRDAGSEESAFAIVRDVSLHELSHAVSRTYSATLDDPAGFIGRVTAEVTSASFEPRSPASHDAGWWRRYSVLIARMVEAAPDLAPVGQYAVAGSSYGFCRGGEGADRLATDAAKWINAARSMPNYTTGRIAEVAARPCPKFDNLLDQFCLSTAAAPAVAASPLRKDDDNAVAS